MSQRPGKTSLIELPKGLVTLQTEVHSGPLRAVTIVDFRGRVIRRIEVLWEKSHPKDVHLFARACHDVIEGDVRASLQALQSAPKPGAAESAVADEPTAAVLFVMAAEALAISDRESAETILVAVRSLLPDDTRVARLLSSIRVNDPRRETHW